MVVNRKNYNHVEKIGPGGMKCSCCADKGSKKRACRKFRRTKRRDIQSRIPSDNG